MPSQNDYGLVHRGRHICFLADCRFSLHGQTNPPGIFTPPVLADGVRCIVQLIAVRENADQFDSTKELHPLGLRLPKERNLPVLTRIARPPLSSSTASLHPVPRGVPANFRHWEFKRANCARAPAARTHLERRKNDKTVRQIEIPKASAYPGTCRSELKSGAIQKPAGVPKSRM